MKVCRSPARKPPRLPDHAAFRLGGRPQEERGSDPFDGRVRSRVYRSPTAPTASAKPPARARNALRKMTGAKRRSAPTVTESPKPARLPADDRRMVPRTVCTTDRAPQASPHATRRPRRSIATIPWLSPFDALVKAHARAPTPVPIIAKVPATYMPLERVRGSDEHPDSRSALARSALFARSSRALRWPSAVFG
jgi:hypothetical protein